MRIKEPRHIAHFGLEGTVKSVELIDVATGVVKRKLGPFKNLIVDAALNAIGANIVCIEDMVEYLAVGTDNTAPGVAQTALGSQVDDRYNGDDGFADVVASGPGYAYWEYTRTRVIPAAYGNGNLTELGFFKAAVADTMWSRMLFLDEEEAPTTLVKTSNETLRVIYSWRVYLVLSETTDNITIDGVPTACYSRAVQANNGNAWGAQGYLRYLGRWTGSQSYGIAYESNVFPAIDGGLPAGDSDGPTTVPMVAYGAGTFYRDQDMVFEPADANFTTGIGMIALPAVGTFLTTTYGLATRFVPKVDKDNTERFTFRARVSWGRH